MYGHMHLNFPLRITYRLSQLSCPRITYKLPGGRVVGWWEKGRRRGEWMR